jgi:hypothetical protein
MPDFAEELVEGERVYNIRSSYTKEFGHKEYILELERKSTDLYSFIQLKASCNTRQEGWFVLSSRYIEQET